MCIFVHVCVPEYACMCISVHVCECLVYVSVYAYVCACLCLCVGVHVSVCVHPPQCPHGLGLGQRTKPWLPLGRVGFIYWACLGA